MAGKMISTLVALLWVSATPPTSFTKCMWALTPSPVPSRYLLVFLPSGPLTKLHRSHRACLRHGKNS